MLFDEAFLRKLERLSVMSRRAMSGQLQGERRSPKRGQSVEFADFRPYSPGDDIRRIDWNAYARLERFFLKLFVEEEDLTVHILVDVSRSMDWGEPHKLGYALKTAGAIGYVALAGLDRVTVTAIGNDKSLTGNSNYFPPHRGKQSTNALFSFLETYLPSNTTSQPNPGSFAPLAPAIQTYANQTRSPGPIIIISDLLDPTPRLTNLPPYHTPLNTLAAKGFEITLLHTLSPDEVDPDLTGDLKLLDSESGSEVEITADYDLLQRYRKGLSDWQAELRRFCGIRGIHYVPVETTVPLEELLFAWLRQYSVLK
jgi:uncharacterized protein (DUF58 family)